MGVVELVSELQMLEISVIVAGKTLFVLSRTYLYNHKISTFSKIKAKECLHVSD